jgi:nitroreductase
VEVAFAVENMMLAATQEGLGSCFVNRFDEEEVRAILKGHKDARAVAVIPLGFPEGPVEGQGAKNLSEIVSYNQFE